jgi:hypothetical protein
VDVELGVDMVPRYVDVACKRTLRGLTKNRTHRAGYVHDWTNEINGTAAEPVVAMLLGRPWGDDPNLDYGGDVGPGVQVRWTRWKNGCLPLHAGPPHDRWGREDFDDHVFFLVTGNLTRFRVHGWIEGVEGKQSEFWASEQTNPCFMVPQDRLYGHDPHLPAWPA